jgi:hypothetical protein
MFALVLDIAYDMQYDDRNVECGGIDLFVRAMTMH